MKKQMYYIDAICLINECISSNILQLAENNSNQVLVYRLQGTKNPEGWYAENIEDLAQELMYDKEGQDILKKELEKKGIQFEETFKMSKM